MGARLALPLIWLIRFYQLAISPLTGPTCRYYPSCSAYGLTALRRFGLIRGGWLMLRRLARCHPWTPGGVDHVPERRDSQRHRPAGHLDSSHDHTQAENPSAAALIPSHPTRASVCASAPRS